MKDDEKGKEKATEPSAEPVEKLKQVDRGTFLKALGVGIGAVGLDMVTGGHLSARTTAEPDSSRVAVQKLMRGLLESPLKARDFLDDPQTVAAEFGVNLTDDEANTIQESLKNLTREAALREGHNQSSHNDQGSGHFNWHNQTTKAAPKKDGGGTAPTQTAPKTPTKKRQ
jgi:hypothetical protein